MTDTRGTYWTDIRSANPHPVCRKSGCPTPAHHDSEWCVEHAHDVQAGRR